MKITQAIEIYTDGSVEPKTGIGSWAFLILQDGVILHEQSGRVKKTDCNRMEFTAAIKSFESLHFPAVVILHTDSRVMIEAVTLKIPIWKSNGWIKKSGSEIPNLDLFQKLDRFSEIHQIQWKWVKAHSGNLYNERCDQLCLQARQGVGG